LKASATFSIASSGKKPYPLDVVGESHYKNNLRKICEDYDTKQGYDNDRHIAEIILEDSNKYDNKAVLVRIDDLAVGHLKKDDAVAYRQRLASLGLPAGMIGYCRASIKGGFNLENDADSDDDSGNSQVADFGVKLDFSPYNFTIASHPKRRGCCFVPASAVLTVTLLAFLILFKSQIY
jgi:hypothetical protein